MHKDFAVESIEALIRPTDIDPCAQLGTEELGSSALFDLSRALVRVKALQDRCLLQPVTSDSDSDYISVRRFLLFGKANSGVLRRKDWRCNGKGYVAYRNFIRRPRNWETLQSPSLQGTPGNRYHYLNFHIVK
nr:hypothetical protein CFP56_19731 [Quercus suber]